MGKNVRHADQLSPRLPVQGQFWMFIYSITVHHQIFRLQLLATLCEVQKNYCFYKELMDPDDATSSSVTLELNVLLGFHHKSMPALC